MCLHTPHAVLNSLSAKTLTRPRNLKKFPPHLRKEKLIMAGMGIGQGLCTLIASACSYSREDNSLFSTARLMIPFCFHSVVCAFIM